MHNAPETYFLRRRDVFLDVHAADNTTALFFASQPARSRPPARWTRSYMHDEPGILLAVKLGLGRAVKPRHTLPRDATLRVDRTFVPMKKPVFLHYRRQRYYGRLHQSISRIVEAGLRAHLSRRGSVGK